MRISGLAREATPVERLRFGVLLVSRESMLVSANSVARRILDRQDGLALESGRLVARSMRETVILHQMVASAYRKEAASEAPLSVTRIQRPQCVTPLIGVVVPIPDRIEWCTTQGAMIYVIDPVPPPERNGLAFAREYGLTPAEARVATIMAHGKNGRWAARALGVSYNTIKTHLKRIYSKTGVDGHRALIRLLLGADEPAVIHRPSG